MKIIIIIIFIIAGSFIVVFLIGFVLAMFHSNKKNRISYAKIILAQVSDEFTRKLIIIFLAFRNKEIQQVNDIVATISPNELERFLSLVGPDNRPREFSSGKFGNHVVWDVNRKILMESGYTINSAKILIEIILYDIGELLQILDKKNNIIK